jgi:lysophospholipid acyltransferase (LPLAT)-like uncharacterized protein
MARSSDPSQTMIKDARSRPKKKSRTPRWFKWLVRHPRFKEGLARLLGRYLAWTYRTTRWTFQGLEHIERTTKGGAPGLVCFWHERLMMAPMLAIRAQAEGATMPTHVLVSGHNDGRFIGQAVGRFGLGTVIGSSSKGGSGSLRNMLLLLRGGSNIVITPDGPRGPPKFAATGVAQLAAATGVPIVAVSAQCRFHFRLPNWDRMFVPFPFGRGVVVCRPPITVPRADWATHLPAIMAALDAACDEADALCGVAPLPPPIRDGAMTAA